MKDITLIDELNLYKNIAYILGISYVTSLLSWYLSVIIFRRETSRLIQYINSLSRRENISDILEEAAHNFVHIFKFEYAVISTIDFRDKKRRIISQEPYSRLDGSDKRDPRQWYSKSKHDIDYNLNHESDILVEVVKRGHQILAICNRIVETDVTEKCFNESIFNDHDHKYLARIYYPIIHRGKTPSERVLSDKNLRYGAAQKTDLVMGVVECGYCISAPVIQVLQFANWIDSLRKRPKSGTLDWHRNTVSGFCLSAYMFVRRGFFTVKGIRTLGQLYCDNLAQEYYQTYCRTESEKLSKQLIGIQSEENHEQYTQRMLPLVSKFIGADFASLSLKSMNYDYFNLTESIHFYPENYKDLLAPSAFKKRPVFTKKTGNTTYGIVHKVYEEKTPYYTRSTDDLLADDPYYIHIYKPEVIVLSELVSVIQPNDNQDIIGMFTLDSSTRFFFNIIHATIIRQALNEFATFYIRKKRHSIYTAFTSKKVTTITGLYQEITLSLRQYFNTDYLFIWERDSYKYHKLETSNKRGSIYKLVELPTDKESVQAQPNSFIRQSLALAQSLHTLVFASTENLVPISIAELEDGTELKQFYQNYDFKFGLTLKVNLFKKTELLIHLLSKRVPTGGSTQFIQQEQDFLNQLSDTIAASLHRLYASEAINKISQALFVDNQSSKDILPKIAEQALSVTRADSITIFPYEKRSIRNSDAIRSGELSANYQKIAEEEGIVNQPSRLANAIVEGKKNWQCWNNLDEYKKYFYSLPNTKNVDVDRRGFWYSNQINSAAAVLLTFAGEPIGVIMVNYAEEDLFKDHPELEEIIMNFCRFAGIPLRNYQLTENLNKSIQSFIENKTAYEAAQQNLQLEIEEQQRLIDILSELKIYAPFGTMVHRVLHHSIGHVLSNMITSAKKVVKEEFTPKHQLSQLHFDLAMKAANNSVAHAKRLITLFNKENFEWRLIDINALIKEELTYFHQDFKNYGIDYHEVYDLQCPEIQLIQAEFSILINNLLQNAMEAIRNQQLFAANSYVGHIKIQTKYDIHEKHLTISVEDNGTGIDDKTRDRMFELGFSTKITGTGIGLYFVYEVIVNKYRGKINVVTKAKSGTRFELRLPEKIKINSDVFDYKPYLS